MLVGATRLLVTRPEAFGPHELRRGNMHPNVDIQGLRLPGLSIEAEPT
jgi:hypothetical protein